MIEKRQELEHLRDRLVAARGPDRELDCYLAAAFRYCGPVTVVSEPAYRSKRFFCRPTDFEGDWIGFDLLNNSERYTASIDGAVTLEEGIEGIEEITVRKYSTGVYVRWTCLEEHSPRYRIVYGSDSDSLAPTEAIGRCRARVEYEFAALARRDA